jgi:hypothetical protein
LQPLYSSGGEFAGARSRCIRLTHHWSQPALALSVPLRGPRRRSPVAQFLVVRRTTICFQI